MIRIIIAVAVFGVFLSAAGSEGPALGTWQFTGKDNTGLVWTGTLAIEKLDADRFNAEKYHSMCDLNVESTDTSKGTRGVGAPCKYDAAMRTVSFSTGMDTVHTYTATLAADGKSLTQGKWTEAKRERKNMQWVEGAVVSSGTWSAKLKP